MYAFCLNLASFWMLLNLRLWRVPAAGLEFGDHAQYGPNILFAQSPYNSISFFSCFWKPEVLY